jgi:hypothetical protein
MTTDGLFSALTLAAAPVGYFLGRVAAQLLKV